jgi:hypothetical protein
MRKPKEWLERYEETQEGGFFRKTENLGQGNSMNSFIQRNTIYMYSPPTLETINNVPKTTTLPPSV